MSLDEEGYENYAKSVIDGALKENEEIKASVISAVLE